MIDLFYFHLTLHKKWSFLVISMKDFFSKCDQMLETGFGHIYWKNP